MRKQGWSALPIEGCYLSDVDVSILNTYVPCFGSELASSFALSGELDFYSSESPWALSSVELTSPDASVLRYGNRPYMLVGPSFSWAIYLNNPADLMVFFGPIAVVGKILHHYRSETLRSLENNPDIALHYWEQNFIYIGSLANEPIKD